MPDYAVANGSKLYSPRLFSLDGTEILGFFRLGFYAYYVRYMTCLLAGSFLCDFVSIKEIMY